MTGYPVNSSLFLSFDTMQSMNMVSLLFVVDFIDMDSKLDSTYLFTYRMIRCTKALLRVIKYDV